MRSTPVVLYTLVALLAACGVGCNGAPEGLAVSIAPAAPGTLDALIVQVDTGATDPQDDTVTYTYAWRVDGDTTEFTQDTVPASATAYGQVWSVSVVPTDGKAFGPTATAEATIANTPPTATVTLEPQAPKVGDLIRAITEADDPDGQPVAMSYRWVLDGSPQDERSASVTGERILKGQVWEVVVTPNDGLEDGEEVRASVTIGNSPPSVASAEISPSILNKSTTASCIASGWEDDDGDAEGALVSWRVDGVEVSTEAQLAMAAFDKGASVVCELTPFDGDDPGTPVMSPPVILGNAPPSVGSLSIGPADPKTRTDVVGTATDITDPDGDEVTLRWTWLVDGAPQGSLDRLPGTRFVGGQTIQAVVIPFDGTVTGPEIRSNILTADNTLPVIEELTIDPVDPSTVDAVIATTRATDADGDAISLTHTWYVDGSVVSAVTGDTLEGDTYFDKGDEIYVIVTPSDGGTGTAVTSDKAYAINTPPPTPSLVFSPEEPDSDEDVTCVIDAQDPDLDLDTITYTFAWTKNGAAYTDATTDTYTGDTVPAEDRADEDEWECTVTPHDGEDNGADASRRLGEEPTGFDTSGSLSATPLRGGSMAGTTYNEDCASGSFLVGISADLTSSSGGYFAELAPRCAPMTFDCSSSSCTVEHGTISTGTYRGGSGSFVVDRDCPTGSVVTGFSGRAGWYMDQIVLTCSPIVVADAGSGWTASLGTAKDVSAVGGTGGSAMTRADCTSGQAATRATIRAATGQVDGFGLGCKSLVLEVE